MDAEDILFKVLLVYSVWWAWYLGRVITIICFYIDSIENVKEDKNENK